MNEIKHRELEYKAKEAMRHQYTSHRTSLPTFEGDYEGGYIGWPIIYTTTSPCFMGIARPGIGARPST